MLELPLTYHAPLITNPDPAWLIERNGEHFAVLRVFQEACWAWAGFQSQRGRKPDEYRWHAPKKNYHRKYLLFDYALRLRGQALKAGFFRLTTEHLEEILALPDLTSNQTLIRDRFVELCDRQADQIDLYGQQLPGNLLEILSAIARVRPYQKQGLCALTKKIRLHGQSYFAKLTDETLSGDPPAGHDDFNEVTTHAAIRALCAPIAPSSAFHIIYADGQHCSLITAVVGQTYDEEDEINVEQIATWVDPIWLQWIVLAEWLCGIGDRIAGNLVVDAKTRRAAIIDATFSWRFHPTFLGWIEEDGQRTCDSFARELWEQSDPALVFSRQVIEEAYRRREIVLAALAPYHAPAQTIASLKGQFAILEIALANTSENIPLATIEHIAQAMVQ